MGRLMATISKIVLPALVAVLVVYCEPIATQWARGRESVLPLFTLVLLLAMLHPRLRQWFVVTLCYGVAWLALRDSLRPGYVPSFMDYDFVVLLRPISLLCVATLAAAAATSEALKPGAVWARRCYFAAAALYFAGTGTAAYLRQPSWQALILCATGIIAGVGCFYSPEIMADNWSADEEALLDDDDARQRAREAAHAAALRSREWRDAALTDETAAAPQDLRPAT